VAAASNNKTLLGIKEEEKKKKHASSGCYCSICGKKLKKFKRRTSENPLSCWQCMILNFQDGFFES
jgi:hypothetical protein